MGQFSCLLKKANPVLIFSQVIHRPKQCRRGNPLRYFYANTAYLGSKALSVTGEACAQPASAFTVESGASYTFSAYVKTSGTHASIALYEGETVLAQQPITGASDWTRFEVSYTNTSASDKSLKPVLLCGSGETVYMDCVQVEKSPTASRYNLIQNGDFAQSGSPAADWTKIASSDGVALETMTDGAAPQLDNTVFKIPGGQKLEKGLSQTIQISGEKGDTYILSGWGKGDSVPLPGFSNQAREFGLRLSFHYTDSEVDNDTAKKFVAQFNPYTNSTANWQYAAAAAVAEHNYSYITVEVLYSYNSNTAYFDGIQLYKEEFSQSYTYDEDTGDLISVVDLQKQETKYEYENNNLTAEVLPNGARMEYTYDDYHNVKTATTDTGIVYSFEYDAFGNNTKVSITKDGVAISSSAEYSSDGNRLVSATDATGKVTTYQYNEDTNVLDWVKYPEDTDTTKTTYTYDNMYRMATAAASTDTGLSLSASYTYADDLLTKIQTPTTTYDFTYGDFALRENIKIGNRTLASYTYTEQDNYLSSLDYGNGDKVQYTYDDQGRVTKQTYEDGATVEYRYDNDGALATVTDSATGRTTTYYYDFLDRMMKYVESGSGYSHSVGYAYDTINNLTWLLETINEAVYGTYYEYDNDNRVTAVANGVSAVDENGDRYVNNPVLKEYTYDAFGRVSQQQTKQQSGKYPVAQSEGTEGTEAQTTQEAVVIKTDSFGFTAPSITSTDDTITGFTSSQVSSHTIDTAGYDKTFAYTYDDNGNILSISDGTNTISYVYDSANQLIRENNQAGNFTHTWTYDDAGNIEERKEYAYTTGELGTPTDTVAYAYGDASWGDLLTSYDGKTITHDEIGNPRNDGTWGYEWQHGRQLKSMSDGTTTWNFTYNADGIRTKRTNGTTTYNYVYNGDKLSQMTVGSNLLQFSYDAAGTPMAVLYNGTTYYYVTNIQGDVIAILNDAGTAVVEYAYDAWGNLLATTGTMATTLGETNPLRYRGYVYDAECGFYYLQSRYYDSEVGRFLNADTYNDTGTGILGNNMFAYCLNNPTNFTDTGGSIPSWATKVLIGTAVIAVAAVLTVATAGTGTALACFAVGALKGALVGAAVGAATGAATGAVTHRVSTGSWEGAGEAALNGAADGYMSGAISGFITGGMNSNVCFVAGTAVLSSIGHVAIETIEVGDYVWAADPETGEVALKAVVNTFVNQTSELVHVTVNDEEIICTKEHPFYSPIKGWTAACKLRAGDILVTVNGEYVVVEKIQHEILESPVNVYNFEVEDFHTYYVADTSILVHNVCKNPGGRHGGQAHRAKVDSVKKSLTKKGWKVSAKESRVYYNGSKYRYPDIQAVKNGVTRYYQIGRRTVGGGPVSRELRALRDLGRTGAKVYFIPYN